MSPESPYGAAVVSALGADAAAMVKDALKKAFAAGPVAWPSAWSIITAS